MVKSREKEDQNDACAENTSRSPAPPNPFSAAGNCRRCSTYPSPAERQPPFSFVLYGSWLSSRPHNSPIGGGSRTGRANPQRLRGRSAHLLASVTTSPASSSPLPPPSLTSIPPF